MVCGLSAVMDLLLFHKVTAGVIYSCLIALYISAIYKIYQKNKFFLEPIHIFALLPSDCINELYKYKGPME